MKEIIEEIIFYTGSIVLIGGLLYGIFWIYQKLWDLLSELFSFKKEFISYMWWKYHSKPKVINGKYQKNNNEPTREEVEEVKNDLYKN